MLSRREFLSTPAAAALANAGGALRRDDSALVTGKPKPMKYDELPGFLSKAQLAPHHTAHYGGALRSLGQIETELETADRAKANANYSAIRELKREQAHAMNSLVLHELYFDGLSAKGGDPGEAARDLLAKRFASVDRWLDDFRAAALAARGWAMLALHPVNGRLYNGVADMHDIGPLVLGIPLVVIDCYEHAYYVDYQNRKGEYVAAFPKAIDWAEVDARLKRAGPR